MTVAATEIAVLETARLILRAHVAADWDDVHASWSHPDVYTRLSGKPSTREESWGRLLRYRGLWPLLGYGYWAVCERATGDFVGDVGFADFKRAIEPSIAGEPEIGWVLTPSKHGLGYATEAARAALAWAEARRLAPRSVCIIDRKNEASLRIAAKLGFNETGEGSYHGSVCSILARDLG